MTYQPEGSTGFPLGNGDPLAYAGGGGFMPAVEYAATGQAYAPLTVEAGQPLASPQMLQVSAPDTMAPMGGPSLVAPYGGAGGVGMAPQRHLVLIPLCRKGDRAGIERQLQAGASLHEVDVEGNTPLHVAAEAPKNEIATVQCLLEHGADANALNYIGAAPLHYVCLRKTNYRGVANILLENGAQINQQTVAGKSALHFACENQLPELVEVLCLFGADVNLPDFDGNMPGHLTLLKEGGRDTVKREILQHLVDYSASLAYANSEGFTPLHLACRSGYIRCVQYLVEGSLTHTTVPKADVTAVNLRGQNGLHLACIAHHAEVAQLILQVFPQSVDLPDAEGNTPLHCCAAVGSLDCAQLLLQKDANTTLRNAQKKTAYDLANIRTTDLNNAHNPELVQILKDAKKGGGCRQS